MMRQHSKHTPPSRITALALTTAVALSATGLYATLLSPSSASAACAVPAKEDRAVTRTVYDVGRSRNVSDRVMLAAFEAGWVESRMNNLSCGDRDSLGVFQQRSSWGTAAQRTNPATAARLFFDRAQSVDANASYRNYTSGQLAQKVQVSAYPDRYDQARTKAQTMINTERGATNSFADGAFVKTDVSATVYGMVGGFPVPISSMNPVGPKGYSVVTASQLASLRAANPYPRDGAFVKSDVSATVYAMVGGYPVPISTMNPVGSKPYAVVTESSLALLRAANPFPRDGAFVKSDAKATVYAMVGGFPVPISTMNPVGSKPYAVVTESSLALLRAANPYPRDGAFVKSDAKATVYAMVGGFPVAISTMNPVGSKPYAVVTESSLTLLRTANPRPRDGAFVKSDVSATVYKIVGGYPVPLSSMNQVGSKPIAVVTESSLALLRTAKP